MDLQNTLQKYKLDELLVHIGDRIRQLYNNQKPVAQETLQQQNPLFSKGSVSLTAWQLSDLAYLAILHSHDFALLMPNRKTVIELVNLFHKKDGQISNM